MCEFCHYNREDDRHMRTCVPRSRWPKHEETPAEETVLEAMGIRPDNICECGWVAKRNPKRSLQLHRLNSKVHREEQIA